MSKYSSYILLLLISILVTILYVNDIGAMRDWQQSLNDWLASSTAPDSDRPNVVLVEIDQETQTEYGEWPWNRDLLADLLAAVGGGQPKAIVADFDLSEESRQDSAGYTGILAGQMSWLESLVIPYDIALATYRSQKTSTPGYLFDHSLAVDHPLGVLDESSSLQVRKVFLPAAKLLALRPKLGFNYTMPDEDLVVRHQPLVMNYEGYYYPSLELAAAAAYFRIPYSQVTVIENSQIEIGVQRKIPIDFSSTMYTRSYKSSAYTHFSAKDILAEGFDFGQLKDKLVLVGLDDIEHAQRFATDSEEQTSQLVVRASIVENIINNNMLTVQQGRLPLVMAILFAIGAGCAFGLPLINLKRRLLAVFAAMITLAGLNYYFAAFNNTLIQSAYLYLELLLFLAVCPFVDRILAASRSVETEDEPVKVEKKNASALPAPEQLANVPVREIKDDNQSESDVNTRVIKEGDDAPINDRSGTAADSGAMRDPQALDLDGDSQLTESGSEAADSATEMIDDLIITGNDGSTIDGNPAIISPKDSSSSVDVSQSDSGGLSLTDSSPVEAPDTTSAELMAEAVADLGNQSLGRYQINGILGKGAMGKVYRGVDPAINRPLALKTIRLDFVSDPEEEAELKERLHREAQAAGKLSHPNIVTIYDVGSEGTLQYIAMEFLEGETLEDMIKRKVRFNFRIMAQIIMQICGALQYAHERQIVHRDIKPANIMILRDYQVKVMDFGIARVESNSMTKTGIAMGTPNYISPEQLRGQAIDARADLFSLGVVIYEMLLGKRPFKGENITSLIYSVLNHDPEKPSTVNTQVPLLFDQIVEKALRKEPKMRYQKASEIMADLADFVEAFARD